MAYYFYNNKHLFPVFLLTTQHADSVARARPLRGTDGENVKELERRVARGVLLRAGPTCASTDCVEHAWF